MTQRAPKHKLRDDILVSVCFTDQIPKDTNSLELVRSFTNHMKKRFAFWEIIIICESQNADYFLSFVKEIKNLRLIKVRPGTPFYRKRAVVASEAIGDVVALVSANELPDLDLFAMLDKASDGDTAVMCQRGKFYALEPILNKMLAVLGRGAGFKVDSRMMQTSVYHRTIVNHLLSHPNKELALRFPPNDINTYITLATPKNEETYPFFSKDFERRIALVHTLLINLSPLLLFCVSILSALASIFAMFYLVYVVVVWLFLPSTEPGWLTLSLMLSASAFFLGGISFGMSLGLQQILSRIEQDRFDDIVGEVNRIELFDQVTNELNIELEVSHSKDDEA